MEKLHKSTFDVIISDLRMPVMDGPGLYQALKNELPSYLEPDYLCYRRYFVRPCSGLPQ